MIFRYKKNSLWAGLIALGIVAIIGTVCLPNEVVAQDKAIPVGPTQSNHKTGIALLLDKLNSIVIDRIYFDHADLAVVLQALAAKSKEGDPDKTGVNFILQGNLAHQDRARGLVNLDLARIPLGKILDEISRQTKLQYTVQDDAIYFHAAVETDALAARTFTVPAHFLGIATSAPGDAAIDVAEPLANLGFQFPVNAKASYFPSSNRLVVINTPKQLDLIANLIDQLNAPHPAPPPKPVDPQPTSTGDDPASVLKRKLDSIVIPNVDLRKADIVDALQFLTKKSRELDPDHIGINFVLRLSSNNPTTSPAPIAPVIHRQVTVVLASVPVSEMLKYICEQTNLQYSVTDYAVYLRPPSTDAEIFTVRTFLAPPQLFNDPGSPPPSSVEVKDQLLSRGIRFPEGATATYLPSSNKLVVRNTPEQLDRVVALIRETDEKNKPLMNPTTNAVPVDPTGTP